MFMRVSRRLVLLAGWLGVVTGRPWAVVTGASSGIGREIAVELAQRGFDVVIAARRLRELRGVAAECAARGARTRVVRCDVATLRGQLRLRRQTRGLAHDVELFAANAGVGWAGQAVDMTAQDVDEVVGLNAAAVAALCNAYASDFAARGGGRILLMGSMAGISSAVPGAAVYGATKAFVRSYAQALADEVAGSHVRVTCVCPGATTATGFAKKAGLEDAHCFATRLLSCTTVDAATVARAAVRASLRGRRECVPGLPMKVAAVLTEWSPRCVGRACSKFFFAPRPPFASYAAFLAAFRHAEPLVEADLRGRAFDGHLLRLGPLWPLAALVTHKVFGPGEWGGKHFDDDDDDTIFQGSNRFFVAPSSRRKNPPPGGAALPLTTAAIRRARPFRAAVEPSWYGADPTLTLKYREPFWGTRCLNMRDELRRTPDGTMPWRSDGRSFRSRRLFLSLSGAAPLPREWV